MVQHSGTQNFLLVALFWASFICVPHPRPPVSGRGSIWKEVILFPLLAYMLEYIYITFIYNIVFLKIFGYNTLSTHTSNSIVLTVGVIFIVFLGPDQ
jgi:hypothetical protein